MIRIALAQINATVGDIAGNREKVLDAAETAADEGADLVAFPELVISGYPPEDLLLRNAFLDDCREAVERLAAASGRTALVVGFPDRTDGGLFNAAAVLQNGRVAGVYQKNLLPNYGVFDEKRYFREGTRGLVLDGGGVRIALHICEDSWITGSRPVECARVTGANVVLNLSASPYNMGKMAIRRKVFAAVSARCATPTFSVNLVGGQDELVFDGGSMVIDSNGTLLAVAHRFDEDLLLYDVDLPEGKRDRAGGTGGDGWDRVVLDVEGGRRRPPVRMRPIRDPSREEEVYAALVLGTKDYLRKNRFDRAVLGVSGGIDSALVAAIARDALGPDRVTGVTMPGPYTSPDTLRDTRALCERLGIELLEMEIDSIFEEYLDSLAGPFDEGKPGVAEENVQARIRGNLLMALSNRFGWLVLGTGNKSETAVGYCTLYGDMAGGLAILKDVPKTLVYDLARWRNARSDRPVIPESVLARPPSAELAEGQKDSDALPPYDLLDPILEAYVEHNLDVEEIARRLGDAETVRRIVRLVDANEYKRRQAPPGIRITPKAFGRDRRLPITNRYR